MLAPTVEQMTTTEHQTTGFMDAAAGEMVGDSPVPSQFDLADAVTSAGLQEFLSRPVRISTLKWNQSDTVGKKTFFFPWAAYFNNPSIKYKLNNYAFLRANLKLKFVVNASPFYSGSMRMCYRPLEEFKEDTIWSGSQDGISNPELIPYSQRPGVWIKPQHSEGAEMTLPFIFPRSFLRVQKLSDFNEMGSISVMIYTPLLSANGVEGTGVTVQVYAWAEDVVLAGPSTGLALQADEYGVGPISGPASTVARIASKLRSVPIISKLATATEIGANAVSGIAKLYGFTNVPVIEEPKPRRNTAFPQLASAEIGFPIEKLALDPKNELSIDPSIVCSGSEDELAIQNFATRQSFLTSTVWNTSTPVDTPLFTARVTPNLAVGSVDVGKRNYLTPLALCAHLFRSWRGDIIFTFRFIATPFHKGRVRISYDPYGNAVQTTGDTGPTVFNKIVDLGAETEVDVRVPYQQALAWCYCYESIESNRFSTSTTPALTYVDTYDNGMISVKVLTELSAPVVTAPVHMQVFVRGAENIEFANPSKLQTFYSPFALQSEEYSEKREGESVTMGQGMMPIDVQRGRVNFGENIRSLRTLMRRMNLVDTWNLTGMPANTTGQYEFTQTRFPPFYGYDPSGMALAKGKLTPANSYPANYCFTSPWHFISNCFLAQRGSMNWSYNAYRGNGSVVIRVARDTGTFNISGPVWVPIPKATNYSAAVRAGLISQDPTAAGASVSVVQTSGGANVAIPNYTAFKFQTTDPRNSTGPAGVSSYRYDGSVYEGMKVSIPYTTGETDINNWQLERYCGIGTDYTLNFFLNCPTLFSLPETDLVPPILP